jgi:hypothetical protein
MADDPKHRERRRVVRVQVRLTPEEAAALHSRCRCDGTDLSTTIRIALRDHLGRRA